MIMARLRTEEAYDAIMKRIDELFAETDESTPAGDRRLIELDVLSELVEEYEKERYPMEMPSLASVITYRMHEMNLTQKDLASRLGITAPRLCEILSEKKDPTFSQARKIATELNIDASIVLSV